MTDRIGGVLVVLAVCSAASVCAAQAQQQGSGGSGQTVYAAPATPDVDEAYYRRVAKLEDRLRSLTEELEAVGERLRDEDEEATDRVSKLESEIRRTRLELARAASGGPPTRRLRYVPSEVNLATWRRPTEYREPALRTGGVGLPVEFAEPTGDSGTVHQWSVVAHFVYGGRTITVAFDSDDGDAEGPTGARVDMSGQGSFHDARLLPFTRGGGIRHEYGFSVVPLVIDGREVPFMAWGRYDLWERDSDGWYIIQFDGYLSAEGLVEIAGRDYPVRIIDSSKNWKLGDTPRPMWDFEPFFSGDSLAVETGDGYFTDLDTVLRVWYGQPVEIDGRLYDIRLTDDGRELYARQLGDDEVGTVRITDATGWWGILISKDYVLNVGGGEGPDVLVPAGDYIVRAVGASFGEGGDAGQVSPEHLPETINVSGGEVTKLNIPRPAR